MPDPMMSWDLYRVLKFNIEPRIRNLITGLEITLRKAQEEITLIEHDLKARQDGETVKNEREKGRVGNNSGVEVKVPGGKEGIGSVSGESDIRHQEYGEVSYTSQTKKG